jgi:thiol:disulfide interchange protein DsbD
MIASKARTTAVTFYLLICLFALGQTSASAQFRQPNAELTTTVEQNVSRAGETIVLELRVDLPKDIHVQSDKPRDPYVIPTLLTLTPPEGTTVKEIAYPESTDFLLLGWEDPLLVFENEFTIGVSLILDVDLPPDGLVVSGNFVYQACDDRVCFAPASEAIEWHITSTQSNSNDDL